MTDEEFEFGLENLHTVDLANITEIGRLFYKWKMNSLFNGTHDLPFSFIDATTLEFTRYRLHKKSERDKKFYFLSDLWYNPYANSGRFNKEREGIFYCSDSPSVSIAELRPKEGDVLSWIKVMVTKPKIKLLAAGASSFKMDNLQFTSKKSKLLNEFLIKYSRQFVPENQKGLYTPTQIFAEAIRIPGNDFDGLLYDSVQTRYNGRNFAFERHFIDKYFRIISFGRQEVLEVKPSGNYVVRCLNEAHAFWEYKSIYWRPAHKCDGHDIDLDSVYE